MSMPEQPWTPVGATLRPSRKQADRWIVLFGRRSGAAFEFSTRVLQAAELEALGEAPKPSPIGATYQPDADAASAWQVLRGGYSADGWTFGEEHLVNDALSRMSTARRGEVSE
jgi:hypothetical protein